jgi:N-methylhydantoinase B/oxoprolinase/acetone carboxylase alpha subunit
LGVLSKWTSYARNARMVVYGETISPSGMDGGLSPVPKSYGKIVSPSGKVTKAADFGIYYVEPGSRITWFVTGGGGFGESIERDPKLVAHDLRDGKITGKSARKYYGFERATTPVNRSNRRRRISKASSN